MKLSGILVFASLFYVVNSHSWLACSDYAEKNAADWDPSKCRGFPRDAARFTPKNRFGIDTGFDFRPSTNGPACKTRYSSSSYSDEYPKAVYYRGQQVILAHPMKNHGADPSCTNRFIPDNGNVIYRGRRGTDRDQTLGFYKNNKVADLGVSPVGQQAGDLVNVYPKPGFQNAPNFCKDTDKALGTYSFNVPTDLSAGEYTFVWRWSFNSAQDLYSTCFDVIITNTKAQRDRMLTERRSSSLYVACGGRTSDGTTAGSRIGCDGAPAGPPPPPEPSNTPAPTVPVRTTRRTTTRRPSGGAGQRATVKITQITGDVELGQASSQVNQRYVNVNFGCPAAANMWNGRLYDINSDETEYRIVQEQASQIGTGKVQFMARYDEPCDYVRNPPIAMIEGKAYS